jgi:hypothetical protein
VNLDPSYLAAFRGGTPPHPTHPRSRAFHVQYVESTDPPITSRRDRPDGPLIITHGTGELYENGRVIATGERVHRLVGAWAWYRTEDFRRLCAGARDDRFRAIAEAVQP